jgi:hypothetical protein
MREYLISVSENPKKKYDVVDEDCKVVRFGASDYEDYTKHKDVARKALYLSRHHKEDWANLDKAGAWSRWILWNKPTLKGSMRDMERRFGIKISFI